MRSWTDGLGWLVAADTPGVVAAEVTPGVASDDGAGTHAENTMAMTPTNL
jgi:hypothetical protein